MDAVLVQEGIQPAAHRGIELNDDRHDIGVFRAMCFSQQIGRYFRRLAERLRLGMIAYHDAAAQREDQ